MRLFLLPISYLFRIVVFIKNRLYDSGLLKTKSMNTSVVSVGNVSTGGTGKTPMVEYLASYFLNKGKFIAIISKGYKRIHDDIRVAELGFKNEKHELSTENFGDESLILLENLSNIKTTSGKRKGLLVVSEDKTKGAEFAYKKFKPEIIIIDDGFQHLKLQRNLDIVIINQHNPKNLIPAGKLREPLSNIKRADIVVLNKKFSITGQERFHKIEAQRPSTIVCEYKFVSFFDFKNKKINISSSKGGVTATGFCGIGEPESFRNLLENQNINIKDFIEFPDHHNYTDRDISSIIDKFKSTNSNYILTTQKDMVRLSNSESAINSKGSEFISNYPIYYAKIKLQITKNEKLLLDKLEPLLM